MFINGYKLKFDCKNGEQYDNIGKFWDIMEKYYSNIVGVGYGWKNDTLLYIIGYIDKHIEENENILKHYPDIELINLQLPQNGWKIYFGKTEKLDKLYDEIYKYGVLDYEIEKFFDSGDCEIWIHRKE